MSDTLVQAGVAPRSAALSLETSILHSPAAFVAAVRAVQRALAHSRHPAVLRAARL